MRDSTAGDIKSLVANDETEFKSLIFGPIRK